jgi:hypothetical protein
MKVRAYIAEARAASSTRHAEFLSDYADLMVEMRDFWQSVAPAGTVLPPEIEAKVENFRATHER